MRCGFRCSASAVAQVPKTRNLDVQNFGDDFPGDAPTGTLGVIRTYFPPITDRDELGMDRAMPALVAAAAVVAVAGGSNR
jgi:hypothetical protein